MKTLVNANNFLDFESKNTIAITFFIQRNMRNAEIFYKEDKYKMWKIAKEKYS